MGAAASPFSQQAAPAAAIGKLYPKKCFWSDSGVCIIYLSPDGKPISCMGVTKACEGKPEDIKTLPFGPHWRGFGK